MKLMKKAANTLRSVFLIGIILVAIALNVEPINGNLAYYGVGIMMTAVFAAVGTVFADLVLLLHDRRVD